MSITGIINFASQKSDSQLSPKVVWTIITFPLNQVLSKQWRYPVDPTRQIPTTGGRFPFIYR